MAVTKVVTIRKNDVGIVLECTLAFTDFDPAGGAAALFVGGDRGREMELAGSVASYTVKDKDFDGGYFPSQVRVTVGGVTVSSETFILGVLP